jgi:hypothetical protein
MYPISLPSQVKSDSVVQGGAKFEEGDFNSIGETQASNKGIIKDCNSKDPC